MIKKVLVVLVVSVVLIAFWYLKIYFIINGETQNPSMGYVGHMTEASTYDDKNKEEGTNIAEINHMDGYRSGVGFSNPTGAKQISTPNALLIQTRKNMKNRPTGAKQISTPNAPIFHCDGRTHCSQMRSCEEAEYFLKNCPNTKMDGDGDQIPCEGQWCHY